jgi:hypothetical protein
MTDCRENTAKLPPQLWSISCQRDESRLLKSSLNNKAKLSCEPLDDELLELEELELEELEELELLLDELELLLDELDDEASPPGPPPPQPVNSEAQRAMVSDGANITPVIICLFIGHPDVVV